MTTATRQAIRLAQDQRRREELATIASLKAPKYSPCYVPKRYRDGTRKRTRLCYQQYG